MTLAEQPDTSAEPQITAAKVRAHLCGLIAFWGRSQDHEIGGFHVYRDSDGSCYSSGRHKGDYRPLIIQARLLYNFSEGMRAGIPDSAAYAAHAYDYIHNHLRTSHGWYGSRYAGDLTGGDLLDTYSNSFAIIGLARYAQATKDREILAQALELLQLIEDHCAPQGLAAGVAGYADAPAADAKRSSWRRGGTMGRHSGNALLHVTEAIARLHDAGAPDMAPRLQALRDFFQRWILDPHSYSVFDVFADGWEQPNRNYPSDFGHALEWIDFFRSVPDCALSEATERAIADSALEHGLADTGLFQARYHHPEGACAGSVDFWHQTEAVNTMRRMAIVTGDEHYRNAGRRLLAAYFRYFVDADDGVFSLMDVNGVVLSRYKGDHWKCDYHPVRMVMGLLEDDGGLLPC